MVGACTAFFLPLYATSATSIEAATVPYMESNISTALNILKDIGESLTEMPYVKTIASFSIQILEIKEGSFSFPSPATAVAQLLTTALSSNKWLPN